LEFGFSGRGRVPSKSNETPHETVSDFETSRLSAPSQSFPAIIYRYEIIRIIFLRLKAISGTLLALYMPIERFEPSEIAHSAGLRPTEVDAVPRNTSQEKVRMKIAVPLFKERVAPYFGASSKILLVEMQGDAIAQEATWEMGGEGAMEIARRLVDLGVEKLICGGIQNRYKNWLIGRGVTVVDNQRGPARDLVQNLFHSIV
jgi:predicted Fe-Mo cluster-binding NifX family protein